jgi:ectoine hydroxylase-related dioxygenase (phytanoyl-CoA dioxygenase family)
MNTDIYNYDTSLYQFKELVCKILNVDDLEKLHEFGQYGVFSREQDQSSKWHRLFYDNFSEFNDLYLKFIKEFIKPLFGGEQLVYQKTPTFRVHLVNNLSVGEFHKDSDYGHGTNEINFWLPFVDTFSTNTIWVESGPELEDYTPKSLDYGEILKFDGANLLHGNKINDTGITRVSVDFRVVKYSEFVPSDNTSINTNIKFDIGGYFDVI